MDAIDIEVLRALHEWRRNGEDGYLVTVVQTLGSAPRPVGALLAIQPGKKLVGSVSGGCIEDDLLDRLTDTASVPVTQRIRYGGNAQEARRYGLPCNGSIELVVERNLMLPLLCGVLSSLLTRPFCAVPRTSVSRIA